MACMKCGSDWVTPRGKNMVSCPECCKQQRCKARKQGRLPAEESKACERCGCEFVAIGGNAMLQSRHCADCLIVARKESREKYRQEVAKGLRTPGKASRREKLKCLLCGQSLVKNQTKYCGNQCFVAAKKAGIQSWDRTGQLESIWHRGGRWACAPSRKPIQEMRGNMHAFLRKVRRLTGFAAIRWRPCKECGASSERRICSSECQTAWDNNRKARRRAAKKAYNKVAGRHFKQRAKRFGVRYIRFAKSMIYERDGYTCQLCRNPVLQTVKYNAADGKIHMRSPTIDHIIPMSKGGNHEPPNCQTACFECNSKKGNRRVGQLRLAID